MFTEASCRLSFVEVAGTPYEVGARLGRHGAEIAARHLVKTYAWATVMAFRDDPRIAAAKVSVRDRFPRYWQELRGLADGLGLSFDDVFAWNCRGDVWAMAPDGCTTVQVPGKEPVLAHNEDGDAGLREGCAIARVRSAGGKAFCAFVYPGSLPGHTFAVTEAGLVETVNNIRSEEAAEGLPRMLLVRAVLDCATIDEAGRLIASADRAGAFHLSLAQAGDPRLLGIEFTHSRCSVRIIAKPECHANHLVHAQNGAERQVVTASSRSRQKGGEAILARHHGKPIDPLAILWDKSDPTLPVYRDQPDDPDDENTLATAIFTIGSDSVTWRVHDRVSETAGFEFSGLAPSRGAGTSVEMRPS